MFTSFVITSQYSAPIKRHDSAEIYAVQFPNSTRELDSLVNYFLSIKKSLEDEKETKMYAFTRKFAMLFTVFVLLVLVSVNGLALPDGKFFG